MDPINPISESPEALNPTPQPPEKSKSSNSLTIISMAIFILMSLGVIVFLYYQNQQLKSMLATYQAQSSPTPSATADPTANWKTYTNPTKTYSFKYPDGLNSDTLPGGTGFEGIRYTFMGPIQTASGKTQTELTDGYSFAVVKQGQSSELDPKTEIEKSVQNSKENCTSISTVSDVVIAKVDAFQYSENCLGTYTITYLSDGNYTYSISQLYTSESYKTVTDQILSTFKFSGAISSASPAPTQKACTLEAKVCPNGSSVGRTGPNCEFTPCP
jgi:hypothetical protein